MATDFYYHTFAPSPRLQPYIDHFWAVRADNKGEPQQQILTPNGRPGMVLCLGDPGTRFDPLTKTTLKNENIYFGATTRPYVINQQDFTCYVGVQFAPFGLAAYTKETAFHGAGVLSDLFGVRLTDLLIKNMHEAPFGEPAVRRLDDFLNEHLRPLPSKELLRLQHSIAIIDAVDRATNSLSIATQLNVSPSTIRRLFKAYIGISPEQFIRITRYASFVKDLVQNDIRPQAVMSALHGFYDEPHAAKDFKKYTGLSRSEFIKAYDGIAQLMYEE